MLKKLFLLFGLLVGLCATAEAFETSTLCNGQIVTILSVDGGGVRGIVPIVYLSKLEDLTHKNVADMFDVMAGVSTGSIIVSLLALPNSHHQPKYSAQDLFEVYASNSRRILSTTLYQRVKTLNGLIAPKYNEENVIKATREDYGDIKMDQLLKPIVVFGYDILTKGIVSFCNWQGCRPEIENDKVADIILGTTAATNLFTPKLIYNQQGELVHKLMDAAVLLNNPVELSYMYATNLCPNAKHYVVLSLGDGMYPAIKDNQNVRGGLLSWLPDAGSIILEGDTALASLTMQQFVSTANANNKGKFPKVLFIRINPALPRMEANGFNPSLAHLLALKKAAEESYVKNQTMMLCLSKLLKDQSYNHLSDQCLTILNNQAINFLESTKELRIYKPFFS